LHEHQSATTFFPTLGGIVDGDTGIIRPTSTRLWNLVFAFEYLSKGRKVSSDMVRRLLGHAMVVCVLNRFGMSVFRRLYDFAQLEVLACRLDRQCRHEATIFAGILPLLYADMRKEWCNTVTASDASPSGYGICERNMNMHEIVSIGKWQERWRYKRSGHES
jgi:hypothetical protein